MRVGHLGWSPDVGEGLFERGWSLLGWHGSAQLLAFSAQDCLEQWIRELKKMLPCIATVCALLALINHLCFEFKNSRVTTCHPLDLCHVGVYT